jgi:uncharacterized protein (DUF983 family)
MLGRGLLRRCPNCGDRHAWFGRGLRGWFSRGSHCRRCGLQWDRDTNGHELGAHTVNLILIGGLVTLGIAAGIIATAPDIKVGLLIAILGGIAVIGPIIAFPFGYTIWMAIDLAARPPQPDELASMAERLAADRAEQAPPQTAAHPG